ncbi:Deoxynucleoside triphosphate triphosphohydrolase SAMHD1 [Armadillidium vulgare]|nr:Deoxynucleoside triphosphate triphosphohydrolase SAMHD1 [Armadillidium vulgare]
MKMNSKVFNDAVHGSIELHPLCVKIINTPQFQRLRFIKQLGLVDYVYPCSRHKRFEHSIGFVKQVGLSHFVYPSAVHTRFEHCIGVCYLAGQFVCTLKDHQPKLEITDKDILCVEIAGLCHDLGHGPFSHLWESFMKKLRPDVGWKHEKSSLEMFKYIMNQLKKEVEFYGLDKNDIIFIQELIVPAKDSSSSSWPYKGRPKEKGFLYQIVANDQNGVDVDKWDYFLRDSHSLGLKVTFDYRRLMKFSRVINSSSEKGDQNLIICFRDKEEANLYDMFHTRMLLHMKAYQHRVTKTFDTMLIDALILANDHITYKSSDGKDLVLCDVIGDITAMTHLHDNIFHKIYENSSTDEKMLKAKEIIHNILTRRYYPYIGHIIEPKDNGVKVKDILQKLVENLPPDSDLCIDDFELQFININYGNKDKNPILNVGFFSKDNPDQCLFKNENEETTFTVIPRQFEQNILRVVCRKYDETLISDARKAFSKTCDDFHIKTLHGSPWSNTSRTSLLNVDH